MAGNLGQGQAIDRDVRKILFMRTIYLDGQYFKVNDQIIEAFTPGVFKAKGVFETMLGLDGVVMDAALHLKRLRAGLKLWGIKAPSDRSIGIKGSLAAQSSALRPCKADGLAGGASRRM